MREENAPYGDRLRALAAVLAAVRGRLEEISDELGAELPEPEGEAVGPESEEGGADLRSILSCVLTDALDVAIRDLLRAAEQEGAPAAAPEPSAPRPAPPREDAAEGRGYGAVVARVDRALPRLLAERERERREAKALFADLAASAEGGRAAVEDERFHRALVVETLLAEAAGTLPEEPERAAELAGLAAAVAGHLADVAEAMEGRARAACRLADARRLAGDLAGAERALAQAALYPGDADVQAGLCRALALLRWEQGRNAEAAALLDRAAALWAEEEVPHEEGACRVLKALLLAEEGRAAEVVGSLRGDLPLLADPWLTLYGGLALALGLAERGLAEKARARRDEGAALVHRQPPAAYLYALRLLGGIAAALGERAAAEARYEELRLLALDQRRLPEAAVATLALLHLDTGLDVESGAGPEPSRAREAALASAFGGADGLDGVLAALREASRQLVQTEEPRESPIESQRESPQRVATALAADLLRLLRLRGVPTAPLPFV